MLQATYRTRGELMLGKSGVKRYEWSVLDREQARSNKRCGYQQPLQAEHVEENGPELLPPPIVA